MIKAITLNLRFTADRWQERFPMIVDLLHTEQPDFVGLQEVALKVQQAHLIQGALNYLNPAQPYKLRVATDTFEPPILANAILSRHPIVQHDRIGLPHTFRIAQRITLQLEETTLTIANTHLHHKPYKDESIRLPQIQAVVSWLDRSENVILLGDFNATLKSKTVQHALQTYQSTYSAIHQCEPDQTFPTPLIDKDFKPRTIDYIFFRGRALHPFCCHLVGNQPHPDDKTLYPSDHFGISAQFNLLDI